MKLKVDKDLCISCGYCVGTCPEVFEFPDDEGPSQVKVEVVPKENEEAARDAKEGCPTEAIKEIKEN